MLTGSSNQQFLLDYTRTGTGFGWINTGLKDIDTGRKFVVQHDSYTMSQDLYRPCVLFCRPYDYPPGDLDCDCYETMSDLTILIDGLFISLTSPAPCPCFP